MRITAQLRLKRRPLGSIWSKPSAQAAPMTEGCAGPHPGGFWRFPRRDSQAVPQTGSWLPPGAIWLLAVLDTVLCSLGVGSPPSSLLCWQSKGSCWHTLSLLVLAVCSASSVAAAPAHTTTTAPRAPLGVQELGRGKKVLLNVRRAWGGALLPPEHTTPHPYVLEHSQVCKLPTATSASCKNFALTNEPKPSRNPRLPVCSTAVSHTSRGPRRCDARLLAFPSPPLDEALHHTVLMA